MGNFLNEVKSEFLEETAQYKSLYSLIKEFSRLAKRDIRPNTPYNRGTFYIDSDLEMHQFTMESDCFQTAVIKVLSFLPEESTILIDVYFLSGDMTSYIINSHLELVDGVLIEIKNQIIEMIKLAGR